MKYYVYVGYYENIISGHKLPKPYVLEKQFNDLEDATEYVIDEHEGDSLLYTEDVINNAIELGYVPNDEDWEDFLMYEESKKSATKSIKESADDNWYKLKMLNEMLDAMEEDEYNIPKLAIYDVTPHINLDEGAIKALIKYYK